jgi:hypothetical protein
MVIIDNVWTVHSKVVALILETLPNILLAAGSHEEFLLLKYLLPLIIAFLLDMIIILLDSAV